MSACPSCSAAAPDGARFCSSCGTALSEAPAGAEVRKLVTVVFCDLAGSTTIGERLDSEVLTNLLARYFAEMRKVIEQYGGSVAKYVGDAVMAVFGMPVTHEDDALRAVRAAAAMRDRLVVLNDEIEHHWGIRLETRTGVNTGEVFVRDPNPGGAIAFGDAVNLAARLEQAAAPGEILLGPETYWLVRDAVEADAIGPRFFKGKSEALDVHRLREVLQDTVRATLAGAPLIGRERELEHIRSSYAGAMSDRRPTMVTLLGEAGIGKSRLALELAESVDDEAQVLTGRCVSYGEGITYQPFGEMLRSLTAEQPLDAILAAHPQRDLICARIGEATGLAKGAAGGAETFWAFAQLFDLLARERPLVLCFEDLHWAEPHLLDLIGHLVDAIRDAGVLVLCLARTELLDQRPEWGRKSARETTLRLEALDGRDSLRLVEAMTAERDLTDHMRTRIATTGGGNPLFLEQLHAAVQDGDTEMAHAPAAIRALLAARLDRLPAENRHLLGLASVEGEAFHLSALAELAGITTAAVSAQMSELERRELVRSERDGSQVEPTYRFRHGLVRDVAYDMLPLAERADLHLRLARVFQRTAQEQDEILGYHLEQAYRLRAALGSVDDADTDVAREGAERLGSAGLRAYQRADITAAVNLLGRATSLLAADDALALTLAPDLGYALLATGDLPRAETVLARALENAVRVGADMAARHVQVAYRQLQFFRGDQVLDVDRQIAEIDEARAVFAALDDHLGVARASSVIADTLLFAGVAEAPLADAAERALVSARRARSHQEEVFAIGQVGYAALDGPMSVGDGTTWLEELVASPEVAPVCRGYALCFLAVEAAMAGDAERAQRSLSHGRALLTEFAAHLSLGVAGLMGARVGTLLGEHEAAEHDARGAYEYFEAAGDDWTTAIAACDLARALCDQGRHAGALELLMPLENGEVIRDPEILFKLPTVLALALAGVGRAGEAEVHALRAVEVFPGAGFLNFRADALLALAEARVLLGKDAEGEAHAREALARAEEKANAVSSARARAFLAGRATVEPG